jgi:NAD(P)-dependent dehydrogenase (short-subunit alcohol dehydrogenase family)
MKQRHVLITGGAGGLGMAVTKLALERGAQVTVPFVDDAERTRLEAHLGGRPSALTTTPADVSDESVVEKLILGMPRIDALIHLVGGFTMGPTHEIELDAWRAHHDLCLTTTFLCCKHALLRMREAGYGRIVTVGSKAAVEPMAEMAAYSAAKAGVVALTRVIAAETKGTGITANCVLPSVINTAANRAAMGDMDAHKWVSPTSLAETIMYLASAAAADVRGAAVPIYGDV